MAKKSNVTLEDFINKYNASRKKKQKTYSQWLNEQGDSSEMNYAEAINDAQKEYDRARAGYGKTGEALSRKGLNGSGYASYLDSNAYSELQNSKREAEKERNAAALKNRSAYAEYLEKSDSAQNRLASDTLSDIHRYGTDDYETSYKLAIAAGLDEETAKYIADIGIVLNEKEEVIEEPEKTTVSVSTKRVLLEELLKKRLAGDNAVAYLMACGIEKEEAEQMAEVAKQVNLSQSGFSSGLFS